MRGFGSAGVDCSLFVHVRILKASSPRFSINRVHVSRGMSITAVKA